MTYKREPLEENEIEALRKACTSFEEELIINVLLETGMRVSEFAKLCKDEISWQRDCITTIGKGGKRRVIPMSNKTRFYLAEFFQNKPKIKYCSRWIQVIVKKSCRKSRHNEKSKPTCSETYFCRMLFT